MVRHGIESKSLSQNLETLVRKNSISQSTWRDLLSQAARLSDREDIGLQIGKEVQIESAGILGYLILNSDSLEDALETIIYGEKHLYHVNFAQLHRTSKTITISWPDRLGAENALFVHVALASALTFIKLCFPDGCKTCGVELTGPPPENVKVFEEFFGCEVRYGSTNPGLTFDIKLAQLSSRHEISTFFKTIHHHQEQAFLSVVGGNNHFLENMQSILMRLIPLGEANLPMVSKLMQSSPRSIQRKLGERNLSYRQLITGIREQLGKRYLNNSALSLSEISFILGYSEQSAFN